MLILLPLTTLADESYSVQGVTVVSESKMTDASLKKIDDCLTMAAKVAGSKDFPKTIRICANAAEMSRLTGLPAVTSTGEGTKFKVYIGEGACDLKEKIIYLAMFVKPAVLYHELGHWFLKTGDEAKADEFRDKCLGPSTPAKE